MEEENKVLCTLKIPFKAYKELSNDVKELFTMEQGSYFTGFPAYPEEEIFLGEFIQAFCEVVLIINNPKYEVTKECEVSTELVKLGQSEESFSLVVNINYPQSDKTYHDILVFEETSQSPGYYSFELLGDQTMFSVE